MDGSDSTSLASSEARRILSARPCQLARSRIAETYEPREFNFPPSDCPDEYYPRSRIIDVFKEDNLLRNVSNCQCPDCRRDADASAAADNRYFDEDELLGEYATIYALLIWLCRPGLIGLFQRNSACLTSNSFLSGPQLDFLRRENVSSHGSLVREIIRTQFQFNIRALDARKPPVMLRREILPIKEDTEPKARGEFGRVYGFTIKHSEYRGRGFGAQQVSIFILLHSQERTTGRLPRNKKKSTLSVRHQDQQICTKNIQCPR
jgi:hypothetical protein